MSGLEALDILTEARIDPSDVIPSERVWRVGNVITVDCWGEKVPARLVVTSGRDVTAHFVQVFSWELRLQDENGSVMDRGEWKATMAGAWLEAEAVMKDRTRVLVSW